MTRPRVTARAYTTADICRLLSMPRSTFFTLLKAHKLPFLEELRPRLGRTARYRADLVDAYLNNEWNRKAS